MKKLSTAKVGQVLKSAAKNPIAATLAAGGDEIPITVRQSVTFSQYSQMIRTVVEGVFSGSQYNPQLLPLLVFCAVLDTMTDFPLPRKTSTAENGEKRKNLDMDASYRLMTCFDDWNAVKEEEAKNVLLKMSQSVLRDASALIEYSKELSLCALSYMRGQNSNSDWGK